MNTSIRYDYVQLAAKVADIKQEHYDTVITLSAALALLIEKGILSQSELQHKKEMIDHSLEKFISDSLHPKV